MGENDRPDEVGIEVRRLERQVDRESIEQCVEPRDLDATVTIGVKPTKFLQRIEGIAAELPDAVVDLLAIAAISGLVAGGVVKAAHTLASALSLGVQR